MRSISSSRRDLRHANKLGPRNIFTEVCLGGGGLFGSNSRMLRDAADKDMLLESIDDLHTVQPGHGRRGSARTLRIVRSQPFGINGVLSAGGKAS